MSVKLKHIAQLLHENYKLSKEPLPAVTWDDIVAKGLQAQTLEVYQNLGGILEIPDILFPPYDLEYNGFAIQVDEEKQFNRYRSITLNAPFYTNFGELQLEKYKSYCRTFEPECLKSASHGNLWNNTFSQKNFGKPGEIGELHKEGSTAWKYLAFQDFLVDLSSIIFNHKVIRLSIYDNILMNNKMYRVNDIILSSRPDYKTGLTKFLERKIKSLIPLDSPNIV